MPQSRLPKKPHERFYMVPGAEPPSSMIYAFACDARSAAIALSRAEPGKRIYVLQAIEVYEAIDVVRTECDEDAMPF
ncbi:hypothetical protein LCGC14_3056920 [marine sediment metagenome]|uniref:Uncharacterized protein n=1 Tax=marine sediment metagenome TaxID=412755 RepID=A0A0F8YSV1_9ZZZZ